MPKSDKLYLVHIIEYSDKIAKYIGEGQHNFFNDIKTQDAVYRNFEVVGEASNRVSKETRDENPHINWSGAVGFRNVIIHNYDGVDPKEVWDIANTTLPEFTAQIRKLLEDKFGIKL